MTETFDLDEQKANAQKYRKELQALARGVKLSDEAENVLRILLRFCDRENSYPPSFETEHVELMQDLLVLLNHRRTQRKRFKQLEYVANRELLIPEAEAIAYMRMREEAYPDSVEEYNNKFNLYFHTTMSKLAFERLGVKDSNTI
tara:strand:+ start:4942 stop:5376 length:435 start_codon:yes stop_codon:yes gene_type:complete